jgi:uncharacterized protein (TIGR02117 family)
MILIFLFIGYGCSTKPHVIKHTTIDVHIAENIYMVRHGWHTGFVIPANTIQARHPQLIDRFGDTPYLEIGWGDKDYYQTEEVTSGMTLRAAFWPTDSVIHAVAVPEKADIHFTDNDVEVLCLDDQQYSRLIGFIEKSFEMDENGNIIQLKSGNYGDSQFYAGEGDYFLMNTCNTWTAKGLKSIGLSISPAFKITAGSIMNYVAKNNGCTFGAQDTSTGH